MTHVCIGESWRDGAGLMHEENNPTANILWPSKRQKIQ
jgi:hypothetical protein